MVVDTNTKTNSSPTKLNRANVNPAEVAHFDHEAAFWWDPAGPFKTLHHLNPVRLDYIRQQTPLAGQKVLDVGCGGGLLCEAMAAEGAQVTGIDLAAETLQTARLHLLESGLEVDYRQVAVEDLAKTEAGQYDVVTCLEMLEHVPDPASVIRATVRLLKPGGTLILSTLNRTPKAMLLGIFAAEHLLHLLPKGTHHFDQFIKPSELFAEVQSAGATVTDICGLKYNPLSTRAWLDRHDVSINYLLSARTTPDSNTGANPGD